MATLPPISRTGLSHEASDTLRRLIVTGDLKPAERLVERDIAVQLGISRTPLREAFFRLRQEGLLSESPGRGLFVSPLNEAEITEIYQVLAALERMAVLHTPRVEPEMLALLKRASEKRAAAGGNVQRTIAADLMWHEALTGFTSNRRVVQMLRAPRALAERYERAFFRIPTNRDRSAREHREIEKLVRAGDLAAAAARIEKHWLDNIEAMSAAIAQPARGERRKR
ncbi:MAG TPA: GntR family transcriptional regulator [Thermoanaerobaculia bacterium]|jgi:DNA-binding GntR family transcriptional regulator